MSDQNDGTNENTPEPRMDLVREAQWRMANGYYEMDFVWEEALARFLRAAENAE